MRKHTQAHTQSSNIILLVFTVFLIVTGIILTIDDVKALSKPEPFVHYNAPDTEVVTLCAQEEVVEDSDGFVDTRDLKELRALMEECEANMTAAHNMAEAARALGYEENHDVIELATEEWERAEGLYARYKEVYDEENAIWVARAEEYPVATYVWQFLDDAGYNDYVIAGIIGNMMVECGGHTLALKPYIYSADGYYGLCQWSRGYQDRVGDTDTEYQCQFLLDTIVYEIDTYGHLYKRGFDYSSFISLTNEKDAALAFARAYERCGFMSYGARRACATTAYNYFVE